MDILNSVPKESHYAIIEIGHYSEVVDYGYPDKPYTESHSYCKYTHYPNEQSFRREIESRIKSNKKSGIDFIALYSKPIQIETEIKIKIT